MDELQLIREFRAGMPGPPDETRARGRERLAAQFEPRSGALVFGRFERRKLLVGAAVALLAGLLAGSALAFGDRLLDFIRGEPAPKSVQREFAHLDPHSVIPYFDYPTVIKGRIHGVLAFDTAGGRVALWAGPTRSGGACYVFRKLRQKTLSDSLPLAAGCLGRRVPDGLKLVAGLATPAAPNLGFAWGYTAKNVASVEVHLAGGVVKRAPVYERFFAVGAPATKSLVSAVGLAADGHEVGRCCPLRRCRRRAHPSRRESGLTNPSSTSKRPATASSSPSPPLRVAGFARTSPLRAGRMSDRASPVSVGFSRSASAKVGHRARRGPSSSAAWGTGSRLSGFGTRTERRARFLLRAGTS